MTEWDFKNIWFKYNWFSNKLQNIITTELLKVDFKNRKIYEIKYNPELGVNGVYNYFFNIWDWSWMNTINTNYSAIYFLLRQLYKLEKRNFSVENFEKNLKSELNFIEKSLPKHRQFIFSKGKVFRDMFFVTQKTWNLGIISIISTMITFSKKYKIDISKINFKRGQKDDLMKGCDFKITIDGEEKVVQHKSTNIKQEGDCFVSTGFIYNEKTYRNNVDYISIEYKNEIHLFKNSTDPNVCGMRNGIFFIKKTQKIDTMQKNLGKTSDFLKQINLICCKNNILFQFENCEEGENYFEDNLDSEIRTLRLFIHDYEDVNLNEILEEKLIKLKNLFQ